MQKYFQENKYKPIKSLYEIEINIKNCYRKTLNSTVMILNDNIQNQLVQYMDELRIIRYIKAKKLGFKKYIDLRIKEKGYYDYTCKDIKKYQKIVEKYLSPNSQCMHDYFKKRYNRQKYDEFITEKELDKEYFSYLIPLEEIKNVLKELVLCFPEEEQMVFKKLFGNYKILEKEKMVKNGSFCTIEKGGIVVYLVSRYGKVDLFEAIHELGHAYQLHYAQQEDPFPRKEMCEIYSIGMELAILPYMKRMFPKQDVFRFYFFQLFSFFIYEAMLLNFQEIIYFSTRAMDYNFIWEKLQKKYRVYEEYGEDSYLKKGVLWLKESEIFLSPLLLTDYTFAQIFVLDIYFSSVHHKEYISKYCELVKTKQGVSIWEICKENKENYFDAVMKKYVEFVLKRL